MKDILEKVARDNGTTVEEVRREMEFAISEARKSTDPQARMLWRSLFGDRNDVSPEEFIEKIAQIAR